VDERALPKPQSNKPIVANPSRPGIQKPNTPYGREAPPSGEKRAT